MGAERDPLLEALFQAARTSPADTSAAEWGFETRLMARLREERSIYSATASLAWRLCPFFAALVLAVTIWSRTPGARLQAEAQFLAEVTEAGAEKPLLTVMTGARRP